MDEAFYPKVGARPAVSDRDGTRNALATLAGVERGARTAHASAETRVSTATHHTIDAADNGHGETSESRGEDDGRTDAADGSSVLVDAGSQAVRHGDTAALVAAAERACADVHRTATFASAGGFAHLAGAVAATDEPELGARGALVLVRVAGFRSDNESAGGVVDDWVGVRGVADGTGGETGDGRRVTTDGGATATHAGGPTSGAIRSDDGTGMSVDPVRTDE